MRVNSTSEARHEMQGKSWPRILVVNNEPFQTRTASGNTLCALFRGWPRESLGCLFDSDGVPEREICARYWKVGAQDLRIVRRVREALHLRRRRVDAAGDRGITEKLSPVHLRTSVLRASLRRLRRAASGLALRDLNDYSLPPEIEAEIDAFAPEIIYSTINRNPMMGLTLSLARRFDIPILPHFFDDWPETAYRSSLLSPFLRLAMLQRLSEILKRAPQRLTIGDEMAEEYGRRYGGSFVPFMNAIPEHVLDRLYAPPPRSLAVTLVYVGALHIGRWRSLQDIGMALRVLRTEGVAAEATVFAPSYFVEEIRKVSVPPVLRYGGELSREAIEAVLEKAHVLVLPEGFGRADRIYTRFSMSTKIPEYLSAGRPIVAYGPAESGSIRYLTGLGCGPVVTRPDRTLLVDALRDVVRSHDVREAYGRRAHGLARERFNGAVQAERFRSVVVSAISAPAARA